MIVCIVPPHALSAGRGGGGGISILKMLPGMSNFLKPGNEKNHGGNADWDAQVKA